MAPGLLYNKNQSVRWSVVFPIGINRSSSSVCYCRSIFSALAQFERRLIQERTRAGLAAARARGKHGGWKPLRPEDPRVRVAFMMYGGQRLTVPEICRTLRISPATFYRYVALGRRAADHTSGNGGLSRGRT